MGNRFLSAIRKRSFLTALLGGLLVLGALSGCDMSGHQSTIVTEGPVARHQLHLFYLTLGVSIFIFLTVGSVLAYAQIKFRSRKDQEGADDPPPQTHGHPLVEMGLIVISGLLLVIIAIPTVRGIWYTSDTPDRENALEIKVTGYQWWFKFEYPQLGFATANELVIPSDRPIHIELRTLDVIHSFWVPKLAGKVDLIPNRANHMWLQADHEGYYWGQCAEFCGESHANMKFRLVSLEPAEFQAWAERQAGDARSVSDQPVAATWEDLNPKIEFAAMTEDAPPGALSSLEGWRQAQVPTAAEDTALINRGRALFRDKTCLMCHEIKGHGAPGITGPTLTHFGSRTTLAAGLLDNTDENLAHWLRDPDSVKPGNIMYRDGYVINNIQLTEDDIQALVAYLHSLK
ncbi:MAG: cytochrome c oxidase subunit II [Opitutaceae bacterium]